jgi:hypothetical protein
MDNHIEMNEINRNSLSSAATNVSESTTQKPFDPQISFKNSLNNTDDIKFIDGTPILLPKKSKKKLKKPSVKYSNTEKQQQQQKEQYEYNWHNEQQQQQQSNNNNNINYEIINTNSNEQQYKTNNNIECENNVKSNEKEHPRKPFFSKNSFKSIKKSPSVAKTHLTIIENENENENGNNDNYDYFLDKSINSECLDNFRDSLINISIASSIRGKNEFQIPTNPPIKVTIEKSNSSTAICQDSLAPFLNSYNVLGTIKLSNYVAD